MMMHKTNLICHQQLFMRSGDDFGMRIQDEMGNVIMADDEPYEDKAPAVIVSSSAFFFSSKLENGHKQVNQSSIAGLFCSDPLSFQPTFDPETEVELKKLREEREEKLKIRQVCESYVLMFILLLRILHTDHRLTGGAASKVACPERGRRARPAGRSQGRFCFMIAASFCTN